MKEIKRWLPGVLVSVILIAAILYFVDLPRMFAAIRSADYRIILVAFVLGFAWLWVRAIVWRTLLRERASYWEVFHSLNIGYLLNALLPLRLGELGRAYMLSLKSDMTFVEILPTIVIERSIDLAITAVIFLSSLPFVVGFQGADRIAIILGVLVIVGLLFLYLLARNDRWALDVFHKLSARWPSIQRFGGSVLESFLAGLGAFHVLDAAELGHVHHHLLSGPACLLRTDAVELGIIRTRRGRRRQCCAFRTRSSRNLRRRTGRCVDVGLA